MDASPRPSPRPAPRLVSVPVSRAEALIAQAVKRQVFWDEADAKTAWSTLTWALTQGDASGDASTKALERAWQRLVRERESALRVWSDRGLRSGAFRHPRHARNALVKLLRERPPGHGLIRAWINDVQRRIEEHHAETLDQAA